MPKTDNGFNLLSNNIPEKSVSLKLKFHYLSRNLATIKVSELQMSFVTYTQVDVPVVYLKSLQISILKISHCDLVTFASQCLYYLWLSPCLK